VRPDKGRLEPEFVHDVEDNDDGSSEVGAEKFLDEIAGRHGRVTDRGETSPELGDKHEQIEDEADPRTDDARLRAEGEFVEGVALHAPAFAETDMCKADGSPGEDGRQTGKGKHPVECLTRLVGGTQIGEKSDSGSKANGHERTTFAVNVSEDSGRLILFGERCEGAGRTIN